MVSGAVFSQDVSYSGTVTASKFYDFNDLGHTFFLDPATNCVVRHLTSTGYLKADRFYEPTDYTYFLDLNNDNISLKVAGKIMSEEIEIKEMSSNNIKTKTIQAEELNLKTDNMADFVFENSYKLLSLEQVEQFVTENKHLPGIPSAEEVMENGINVAEMNGLLLQKIEELTLYVIGLKKENELLKDEIQSIKK